MCADCSARISAQRLENYTVLQGVFKINAILTWSNELLACL